MAGGLSHVAFDIETTGFDADDVVTVVGFELELGCRVFVQTDGTNAEDVGAVSDGVGVTVQVSVHASEAALLEAVGEFVGERLQSRDVLLVAFNGETWRGGFDVPFLRTRYAAHDVRWPFRELPYADLLPVVRDLFNTTVEGEDASDLETAYDVLCDGTGSAIDPFEDSAAAVTAFENDEFDALVLHNVADVIRTGELSRLAQRYCSKSDFNLKSLTPAIDG